MKSFFSSVVTAALCLCSFAFVSCDKNENKTPDPLTFSVTKAEVEVGKTVEVTVKNGTQPFTVKSSDEKIATVKVEKEKITVTGSGRGNSHDLCSRQKSDDGFVYRNGKGCGRESGV